MIDAAAYKKALGSFPTGVCVLTMRHADSFHGVTVSSLSAVSLSPPLISFCIEHTAHSFEVLKTVQQVTVNILGADQQKLCWHFAKHGKWNEEFDYQLNAVKLPVFDGGAAMMSCSIQQRITAGDHDIFICQVNDSAADDSIMPMVYNRGKLGQFQAL